MTFEHVSRSNQKTIGICSPVKKYPPWHLLLRQLLPTAVSHSVFSAVKNSPMKNVPRDILTLAEVCALWMLSSRSHVWLLASVSFSRHLMFAGSHYKIVNRLGFSRLSLCLPGNKSPHNLYNAMATFAALFNPLVATFNHRAANHHIAKQCYTGRWSLFDVAL